MAEEQIAKNATDRGSAGRYKYLSAHPDLGGPNPGQDAVNLKAWQSYVGTFGEFPTDVQFNEILPAYQGPGGEITGNAFLAQKFKQFQQSPEALRGRSGEFTDQINRVFQNTLGRDANASEIEHFGTQLASGFIDEFGIQQQVNQLPEALKAKDVEFRSGLNEELQGFEQERFEDVQESIISRFVRGGIDASPALDQALVDAATELSKEREKFLSGISFQQFQGNKGAARSSFEQQLNQFIQQKGLQQGRTFGLQDLFRQRGFNAADFATQEAAFSRLAKVGGGGGGQGLSPLQGGLAGAGIGAQIGGGPGAFFGGLAGAGASFV